MPSCCQGHRDRRRRAVISACWPSASRNLRGTLAQCESKLDSYPPFTTALLASWCVQFSAGLRRSHASDTNALACLAFDFLEPCLPCPIYKPQRGLTNRTPIVGDLICISYGLCVDQRPLDIATCASRRIRCLFAELGGKIHRGCLVQSNVSCPAAVTASHEFTPQASLLS